jgi:hypothetical protein
MNLDNMATELRRHGLKVVEIDGWITRGYRQQDLQEVRAIGWHHTATNRNAFINNNCPTLPVLVNGRSDVAGPLCNLGLGRDGTVYVVATGVANHFGAGSAYNIPTDMGNHYAIGIEMESSGVAPWDWTAEQLYWAPRLGAALELIYLQHLPPEKRLQLGHMEYSSQGKIDPAGWPGGMDGLRNSINNILNNGAAPAPKPVIPAPAPHTPAPPSSSAPAGASQLTGDIRWIVESGDTLSGIAAYFKESVASLAAHNGIKNPNAIKVGEWIWPSYNGKDTWTVDPGDTISSISRFYGGNPSVASIIDSNGVDPNRLSVGLRLNIPK